MKKANDDWAHNDYVKRFGFMLWKLYVSLYFSSNKKDLWYIPSLAVPCKGSRHELDYSMKVTHCTALSFRIHLIVILLFLILFANLIDSSPIINLPNDVPNNVREPHHRQCYENPIIQRNKIFERNIICFNKKASGKIIKMIV